MAKKAAKTAKPKTKKAKKATKADGAKKPRKPAAPKRPSTVQGSLSSLATKINARSNEKHGYDVADQSFSNTTDWITTTCTPLDVKLWGGFPRGRIIEFHGDPSVGKSTLLESAFAGNQRVGGECVLLMSESCVDRDRMARQGIDLSRILIVEGNTVADNVLYIYDVLKHRETLDPEYCRTHPMILGWDTPSNAQEAHIWEDPDKAFAKGMTSKARDIRSALRTITPLAGRLNVAIFLLLQVHQKIGSMYAGKDTDCGGGPKFNASLRINARQVEKIEDVPDHLVGIISEMNIIKSKAGPPPFRGAKIVIRSLTGIDNDLSMYYSLLGVPATDPCPVCGGKVATKDEKTGARVWVSMAWKECPQCNGTGTVYHLIDGKPADVCVSGMTENGNKTAWRYIFGWPPDEKLVFKENDIREFFDARPGLRTWLAAQCWKLCSKPEPPLIHPVEILL